MNGKKILTKLIVIFAIINIVLFTFNILKTVVNYRLSETRINNVIYALEQKEIYIDTQLPRLFTPKIEGTLNNLIGSSSTIQRYEMVKSLFGNNNVTITKNINLPDSFTHRLGGESLEFNKSTVIYTNEAVQEESSEIVNIQEAKRICKDFIKRLNYSDLFEDAYIEYSSEEEAMIITFYMCYKGLPVFDTYINFRLIGNKIRQATIKVGEITTLKEDEVKKAIYPIDLVLFGIDDELNVKKPIHITDIRLGYKTIEERNIALLGAQIIPVYKMQVKGLNTPIYVNAYTNKRIE